MTRLEKALAQHKVLVDQVAKLGDAKNKAVKTLGRIDAREDRAIKAVTRSSKRLDKLREEEKAAKEARKLAKRAELPIAV